MFISFKKDNLTPENCIALNEIGQSTGFLGIGRKCYLIYDEEKQHWGVKTLSCFQRVFRYFGYYRETFKGTVKSHLASEGKLKTLRDNLRSLSEQQIVDLTKLDDRIHSLWEVHVTSEKQENNPPSTSPIVQNKEPRYEAATHQYQDRNQEAAQFALQMKKILKPEPTTKRNISTFELFGNWEALGYRTESESVMNGRSMQWLEKVALNFPEFGNYAYVGARGNGECGYRAMVTGLVYTDCILKDNIDSFSNTILESFNDLSGSWEKLKFPADQERHFSDLTQKVIDLVNGLKSLSKEERIKKLQQDEFINPFLQWIRCLIVSKVKEAESSDIEEKQTTNTSKKNEIYGEIQKKLGISDQEISNLIFALNNYSLIDLMGEAPLSDIEDQGDKNQKKEENQQLVQRLHREDENLFNQVIDILTEEEKLGQEANIIIAQQGEMYQEEIFELDQFLRTKAFSDGESSQSYWALGIDFLLVSQAFNKNICIIWRDQPNNLKVNEFRVQKSFNDRPADFYAINSTGRAHYDALLPLS